MASATTLEGPTFNPTYNKVLANWIATTTPNAKPECENCGCDLTGCDVQETAYEWLCDECASEAGYDAPDFESYDHDSIEFADPSGNSALRAETASNPRNLPCPSCGGENLLTPADRARGYCCDRCADAAERGGW